MYSQNPELQQIKSWGPSQNPEPAASCIRRSCLQLLPVPSRSTLASTLGMECTASIRHFGFLTESNITTMMVRSTRSVARPITAGPYIHNNYIHTYIHIYIRTYILYIYICIVGMHMHMYRHINTYKHIDCRRGCAYISVRLVKSLPILKLPSR